MIKVLRTPAEMRAFRKDFPAKVGFVPTMGALHQGHADLLRKARQQSDIVVLSIFVNPTQFNDPKDLEKYPATWDEDLKLAEECGVNAIFFPKYADMYPDGYRYKVIESDFSKLLCGKDRPGHFDGVLSVVMKLLNIVAPQVAFFGEKDFQQLTLIKEMTEAFFMDLKIVAVPTVREADGLAMSSRNVRLTAEERAKAPLIYQAITKSTSATAAAEKLNSEGFQVDYVTDIGSRRFVAARLGAVRLIDNVEI